MQITYRPKGVCSQLMEIETEGNIVRSLKVTGGCSGNLQGKVIARLEGVRCGSKRTSCPDQLAQALKQARG